MSNSVRRLTTAALLAALATVLLCFAGLSPTGRIAITVIAGFCSAVVMLRCGTFYACGCFAVSAVLGLLLSPIRSCALLYLILFGWYPIAKSFLERIHSRALEWLFKLILFNAAFAVVWFAGRTLLTDAGVSLFTDWRVFLAWMAANALFVIYDICLSWLIQWFLQIFAKK